VTREHETVVGLSAIATSELMAELVTDVIDGLPGSR